MEGVGGRVVERRSEVYGLGRRIAVVARRASALVVDRGGWCNLLRDLASRRSRSSGEPLGLAVSGCGYAVHLQPPDLRALAAGALPDLAGAFGSGVLVVYRGRAIRGGHPGPFRGGGARGAYTGH